MKTLNISIILLTIISVTITTCFTFTSSYASHTEVSMLRDELKDEISSSKDDIKYIRDRLDKVYDEIINLRGKK